MKNRAHNFILLFIFILSECFFAQENTIPFSVKPNLFDYSNPNTLGLEFAPQLKTYTVYSPTDSTNKYNNGAVFIIFKGEMYLQWQTSQVDEDAPDTYLVFSKSRDGISWTKPITLAPQSDTAITTSGGWWSDGETLVAYINVWPKGLEPKGGYVEYITSTNGLDWSERKPLLNNLGKPVKGIFEQDPHALPNGRIISAVHEQPGMIVSPYYTDDPLGIIGWTKGIMQNLPSKKSISREIEPSWFYQSDGNIVMIFRDQNSSHKKLASVSNNNGISWSTPVLTNMPDSRSKQCAGNFPDGTAFMISNPANDKTRIPLVITLSKYGKTFDSAFLLRSGGDNLQPMRYEGKYKRAGYSYPKAFIYKGFLYTAYSTNKEDIEVTRIQISNLKDK